MACRLSPPQIRKGPLELVLLPQVGGRIMRLAWQGEDLIFTHPDFRGRVEPVAQVEDVHAAKQRMGFRLWGGEKTWLAPQGRWTDGVPFVDLDSGAYTVDTTWEVRGGRQHFVYSKLMCWVALDRGLRLADKRSFPADRDRWMQARDAIYEEIMDKGWNPSRNAFVQSYGSDTLDASNLFMPLSFFVSPTDPRMLSTLDATMRELVSDSLVYRYNVEKTDDGLLGEEGTFSICTFWLVEALTRAGRADEARLMFEKMLGYANHLGLYAEEIGPSGELLGNFPQAFTHLALISAAYNLDKALGTSRS